MGGKADPVEIQSLNGVDACGRSSNGRYIMVSMSEIKKAFEA
jgi:hypothetical protein